MEKVLNNEESVAVGVECVDAEIVNIEATPNDATIVDAEIISEDSSSEEKPETLKKIDDELNKYENIVTDDNFDAFKLLNYKSKLNDINSLKHDLISKQITAMKDPNDMFAMEEVLKSKTLEEIEAMTDEEIDGLFVGRTISDNMSFDTDADLATFKRDFVTFLKKSNDAIATFDEEMEAINKELEESKEEFARLEEEFGNVGGLIRSTLLSKSVNATTDEQRTMYDNLLASFDNGLTLTNLLGYMKTYRGKNILSDYRDDKKAQYVYKRYRKVCDSLKIETDLAEYSMFEVRVFGEDSELTKRHNIFLFSVIHYVADWNRVGYTKADGLFLTQLAINVKNAIYKKFDNEDDKEVFLSAVTEVIQLIG